MSNTLNIVATEFRNRHSEESTYGFRIYDDYGQTYCNLLTEEEFKSDDLDLFQIVLENLDDTSRSMIDGVKELSEGVYINGSFYENKDLY